MEDDLHVADLTLYHPIKLLNAYLMLASYLLNAENSFPFPADKLQFNHSTRFQIQISIQYRKYKIIFKHLLFKLPRYELRVTKIIANYAISEV